MTSMSIESMGAFTPIGADVPTTMASVLTRVQRFSELATIGTRGEPVLGSPTLIPGQTKGIERLQILASLALDESIASAPEHCKRPLPLILCCGSEDEMDGVAPDLLSRLLDDSPAETDPASSRVLAQGRGGMSEALAFVEKKISSGNWPGCHLLAVDSLVSGRTLRHLVDDERVIQPGQPDGIIPGEGAVSLLLAPPSPGRRTAGQARFLSTSFVGAASGADPSWSPHQRLAGVIRRSLRDARIAGTDLTSLAHDGTTRRCIEEITLSRGLAGLAPSQVFTPLASTGDLGAASGLLVVAVMAFFMNKGIIDAPGICLFTDNSPARGAAVIATNPAGRNQGGVVDHG